jgi:hypothetical protein
MATTGNSCFFQQFRQELSFFFNRGEVFLEINQSETRIACGGHVC